MNYYRNQRSNFDKNVIDNEREKYGFNNNWSENPGSYIIQYEYNSTPTNSNKPCYSNLINYDTHGYRPIRAPVPVTSRPLFLYQR